MIDTAIELLGGRRIGVITGAGISTDSGIPDYRGAGTPRRTPMTIQRFLSDEDARRRYWAGGHLGWQHFNAVRPNAGHFAIARLDAAGLTSGVVTQNVDALHERAGSQEVTHVHGTLGTVSCLRCKTVYQRTVIAERIAAENPWIQVPEELVLQPDGDVDIAAHPRFVIPSCVVCGGILKPDVVFFGETVPREVFAQAQHRVRDAEVVLVAGSSLAVNSGIRLLETARRRNVPVIVVNRGVTKWDQRAAVKIDGGTSEVLSAFADALVPADAPEPRPLVQPS